MTLTTIETSTPGSRPTILETRAVLTVHLAGPGETGGTGPILCGFDRFQDHVGFSVGGGTTGPGTHHRICRACAALAEDQEIHGTHSGLFRDVLQPLRDTQGDVWTLGADGLLHTPETAAFSRAHVERKWGPLAPLTITLRDIDNRDDDGAPFEATGPAEQIIRYLDGALRNDLTFDADASAIDDAIAAIRRGDIPRASAEPEHTNRDQEDIEASIAGDTPWDREHADA